MTSGCHIEKAPDRPIVLVGMMGSGKTRLGQMLAKALGVPFVDTDNMVVEAAGMGIPRIFAEQGEEAFRLQEEAAIRRVLKDDPVRRVISTGGGAVMRPENAALIFGRTLSIWTRAEIDVLVERVARNNNRPLLQNANPEETLRQMAEIRYPVYRRADMVVDTDGGTLEEVLARTLKLLEERMASCTL